MFVQINYELAVKLLPLHSTVRAEASSRCVTVKSLRASLNEHICLLFFPQIHTVKCKPGFVIHGVSVINDLVHYRCKLVSFLRYINTPSAQRSFVFFYMLGWLRLVFCVWI